MSNLARPRKPAALKAGKSETKAHLDAREKIEDALGGGKDKVYNIPQQLDEMGKEYYMFLVDELEASDILTNLDIPVLTQTADCLSKMQQADSWIAEKGIIYYAYDREGNAIPKEHPAVGVKQKYLNQFRALSTQLGLSPSSRASLAEMTLQKQEDDVDPVMKLLEGLNGDNGNE